MKQLIENVRTFVKNKTEKFVAVAGGVMVSMQASAAVDVTAITAVAVDVAAVGAAVFGIFVAIKAIKLVRRAL